MKIYFAGAIRGGREKVEDYQKIIAKLQEKGTVLTTHIGIKDLSKNGEQNLTEQDIYNRDMNWLRSCDILVAEVSVPSLGVGYELAMAKTLNKRVICLFDSSNNTSLSAMIAGDDYYKIYKYNSIEEALKIIENMI